MMTKIILMKLSKNRLAFPIYFGFASLFLNRSYILLSILPNSAFVLTANAAASNAPHRILTVFVVLRPSNSIAPSPPALINEAMVAMPIVDTVARRNPVKIAFFDKGSCILKSTCILLIPIPFAASMIEGSTPFKPSMKLRNSRYWLYKIKTIIAVNCPSPVTGINNANKARLGIE